MDISDHLDLISFESGETLFANDTDFDYEGLSMTAPRGTVDDESNVATDHPDDPISIERFFEVCFDTDIQVVGEEEFDKGKFLGAGNAMTVFKGNWRKPSRAVAMKYFNASIAGGLQSASSRGKNYRVLLDACMLELQVLSHHKLRLHENIADILAVSWQSQNQDGPRKNKEIYPIMIMELASEQHHTLAQVLANSTPFSLRLELLRDVLEGLLAVHQLSIVYGDIKPENILIFHSDMTNRIVAKLSDFGFCQPRHDFGWEAGGTPYWNAPECLRNAPNELKAFAKSNLRDIYSFGLLSSFLLTEESPFADFAGEFEKISQFKLGDRTSDLLSSKWRKPHKVYEFRKGGRWRPQQDAPCELLSLLPATVCLQADQRPSLDQIRKALAPYTSNRSQQSWFGDKLVLSDFVTNKRYVGQVGQEGWDGASSLGQISPEIPHQLKRQLYQRLLNQINDASRPSEQITALVRLGDFFIKAFGTEASLAEALKWYVRASERGSKEAMAMIFRLERVLRRPVKDMFSTITTETRSAWMVECLLSTIKKEFDPKLAPAGTKFVEAESKMRQVLNNNPWLAEAGLRRDLDYAIVKIRTMKRPTPRIGTDVAFLPGLANASCKGEILQAIVYDLPEMLNDTLQSNPNLEFLKPRLFRFAAEMGAVRTIRILAEKHRCNVEFIDFESGQRYSSLVEAAIRSDLPVFIALAQCGADYTCLMDREAMDQIIRTAPDLIMREAFNAVLGKEATEPIRELYDPVNICHQFIDGVCPAVIFSRQEGEKRIPPDNTNSPPVFEAILFSQLDKLQSLLTRGGNPNVCFQGLTALHYAVRLCRPMAALLLMAFGADPNARNSSSGYGTPLHALSEKTIKPGSGKAYEDGKYFRNTDFLLRDYEPLPETQEEFDNQRLLILQLLRAYGARSDVLCIDGYTPLMTAIASPACSAPGVVSNFMTAGVSMADKSLRGESVFHICVLTRNSSALRKLLRSADVEVINSPDNNGATPLFIAAVQNGMEKIIKILLEAGSDVAIRGPDGLTPLDVAMIEGQMSNVMTILDHLDEVPLANRLPMLAGSPVTSRNAFHFLTYLPNQNRMVEVLRRVLSWSTETEPILSKDQWGFSAIDYARHRNAQSALRLFNEHLQFNSIVIKKKVPDPEWKLIQDAVESTKSYRQKINSSKSNGQAHTEFCHQSQEEIGGTLQGQPRLTPAEIGHLKVLEATIRERGERDLETIWCMNNLGTVHERYGRLSRAQDILYRGWTVSKEALGNEDLVTKDFTCKFLRVIRDRSLEGVEGADVTNWHAEHGQNTLNTAFEILNFPEAPSEEEYSRMTVFGRGKVTASVCSCDREMCLSVSLINCPECGFARYCSESCRADDIIDPHSDHLSVCFPTDSLEKSPATVVYRKDPTKLEGSGIFDFCWSELNRFIPATTSLERPEVRSVTHVDLNPSNFHQAIAYRVKPGSTVVFFQNNFCESRVLMRPLGPWRKPGDLAMFTAVRDLKICLRPVEEAVARAENKEIPFMVVVEFAIDLKPLIDTDKELVIKDGVINTESLSAPSRPEKGKEPLRSGSPPIPRTRENIRLYPAVRESLRKAANAAWDNS